MCIIECVLWYRIQAKVERLYKMGHYFDNVCVCLCEFVCVYVSFMPYILLNSIHILCTFLLTSPIFIYFDISIHFYLFSFLFLNLWYFFALISFRLDLQIMKWIITIFNCCFENVNWIHDQFFQLSFQFIISVQNKIESVFLKFHFLVKLLILLKK